MTDGQLWVGVATIVAVIAGPILAVLITRHNDQRRAVHERRIAIFRTLMGTRRLPIHFDHVQALNLVEVEFLKDKGVIDAWRNYLGILGEKVADLTDDEANREVQSRRNAALTRLISEIAKVLKVDVEQLDILDANYVPKGWEDEAWEQRLVRRGLIQVLEGKHAIRVQPAQVQTTPAVYPPRPADMDQ